MSDPTDQELHNARVAGFRNQSNHLPPERRDRLTSSFAATDQKRQRNVSVFRDAALKRLPKK